MKAWLSHGIKLLFVVLFLPQLFLALYFFTILFLGQNWFGLWKALFLYGLTISWVSAPFLVLLSVLILACIRSHMNAWLTFAISVLGGFIWLIAWNLCIYPVFTYGRATLPILFCAIGVTGYVQAHAIYAAAFDGKKDKKESADQAEGLPR